MGKPVILVTAYAVDPYKGSEDGMGWNMILEIARYQKVIAITRENNQPAIEQYLDEHEEPFAENIQFEYFDTPYYTRFWKKGGRGALLYFYYWQFAVANWIKSKDWKYDIVHNLNFHNDWTPSFLWKTNKPLVWGPIGHHPKIGSQFLLPYGFSKVIREGIRWTAKNTFWKLDPFLKKTKKEARHIFAMNKSVAKKLKLPEHKLSILPSVATEKPEDFERLPGGDFNVLSVGRFVPLKGFDLTIRAFAAFYHSVPEEEQTKLKLTLVGKGPAENYLRSIIKAEKVEEAVKIISWIDRDKLSFIYQGADVFLFPSHEGAGMVVAEALSYGLPVLCLDNCGPGEFINSNCGIAVPYQNYSKMIDDLKNALLNLYENQNLRLQLSKGAKRQYNLRFSWPGKGLIFKTVYDSILEKASKVMLHETEKENYVHTPFE